MHNNNVVAAEVNTPLILVGTMEFLVEEPLQDRLQTTTLTPKVKHSQRRNRQCKRQKQTYN